MERPRSEHDPGMGSEWLPTPVEAGAGTALPGEACTALVEAATCASWQCHVPVSVCVVPHHGHIRFFAPASVPYREASRCGMLALVSALEGRVLATGDASTHPDLRGSPHLAQPSPVGLLVSVPLAGPDGAPFGAIAVLAHEAGADVEGRVHALHEIADELSARIARLVAPGRYEPGAVRTARGQTAGGTGA